MCCKKINTYIILYNFYIQIIAELSLNNNMKKLHFVKRAYLLYYRKIELTDCFINGTSTDTTDSGEIIFNMTNLI